MPRLDTVTPFHRTACLALVLVITACETLPVDNTVYPHRTTDGGIALSNLDAQIDGLQGAFLRNPSPMLATRWVDSLIARASFTGSFEDLGQALAVADQCVALNPPTEAKCILLRATAHSSVHRFHDSLEDVNHAETIAPNIGANLRATIAMATGDDLGPALTLRRSRVDAHRSLETLADLAATIARTGDYQQADILYREAIALYADVSPLPLAALAFQRGVMWGEQAARPDLALQHYREAVRLLPNYVVANVHLAELEVMNGETTLAIERLERVIRFSSDPEPAGKLAALLQTVMPSRSTALLERARARYEILLNDMPAAFFDHASEFFVGPGNDPQRALQLALSNLEIRRDSRAYLVALNAAQAAHNIELGCTMARQAAELDHLTVNLQLLLEETWQHCQSPNSQEQP
ncbi:MAG: hypothetical protein R3C68_12855 [Myxococcota bacterium]